MSLLAMLESTGVLKRGTTGRDAQQGKTQDPFVAISAVVPCSVQPLSVSAMLLYQQRNTNVDTQIFFAQDIQAQISDRFEATRINGKVDIFLVVGFEQQVDREVVWRMLAKKYPPPLAPTVASFTLSAPGAANINIPFSCTVTAVDSVGNPVTSYSGTLQFYSFTDPLAVLAGPVAITGGTGTYSNTFNTAGNQTLFVQDTGNIAVCGDSDLIDVSPLVVISNLVLTPSMGGFVLTWSTNIPGTSFNIWRSLTPGGETLLSNTPGPDYPDPHLLSDMTYYYQVSGLNASGEGPRCLEVSGTTT